MKRYFMSIIDFSEIENVIAGDEQLENAKEQLKEEGLLTEKGNPSVVQISALSKQIAERFLYKLSRRLQRREGGLEETYEAFRRMEQKKEYTAMYFYLTFLYGFMEWRVPRKVELLPASNEALKVFFAEFCNRFEEFLGEFQERKPRDAE